MKEDEDMKEEYEEKELDDMAMLFGAMKAAREAFDEFIEEYGVDPAYWELGELTGWVLSTHDFKRTAKLIMNDNLMNEGQEGDD